MAHLAESIEKMLSWMAGCGFDSLSGVAYPWAPKNCLSSVTLLYLEFSVYPKLFISDLIFKKTLLLTICLVNLKAYLLPERFYSASYVYYRDIDH